MITTENDTLFAFARETALRFFYSPATFIPPLTLSGRHLAEYMPQARFWGQTPKFLHMLSERQDSVALGPAKPEIGCVPLLGGSDLTLLIHSARVPQLALEDAK